MSYQLGSLLSTTLVGPSHPTNIVAFGAGQQILAHLDLHLKAYPSVQSCTIINRSMNQRFKDMISSLRSRHPTSRAVQENLKCLEWTAPVSQQGSPESSCPDEVANDNTQKVQDALSVASIIITATPSRVPLFPSSWVPSGAHVILIGSYTKDMREVDRELIMRAVTDKNDSESRPLLLVDSVQACFEEAGELVDARLAAEQMVEIGKVVLERRQGNLGLEASKVKDLEEDGGKYKTVALKDFDGPITLFKSVGVGLQDVAIVCAVVDKAEEMRNLEDGVGVLVEGYDGF
jgi:ornithine cyclodeaminase/alanine dehydrogenase-like protein (mu-crystallin family)